jgi:stalled ribosome rescue protein Dom34
MKATKKVGIWLDHTTARVIEYNTEELKATTVKSDLKGLDNQEGVQHSESLLHHKENQHLKDYYKNLITILKDYDEILLFGPTTAKTELYNLIREEHKYDHLKIDTKATVKMSPPEEHAFVVNHFKTVLNYESPFTK